MEVRGNESLVAKKLQHYRLTVKLFGEKCHLGDTFDITTLSMAFHGPPNAVLPVDVVPVGAPIIDL